MLYQTIALLDFVFIKEVVTVGRLGKPCTRFCSVKQAANRCSGRRVDIGSQGSALKMPVFAASQASFLDGVQTQT